MVVASLRGFPLLGTLREQARALPERHRGLVVPDEVASLDAILDELADQLELDDDVWKSVQPRCPEAGPVAPIKGLLKGQIVAIARDRAFCFCTRPTSRCCRRSAPSCSSFLRSRTSRCRWAPMRFTCPVGTLN